jgi:GDP-4-dehydro-6-deoxy-D-mannose reductase
MPSPSDTRILVTGAAGFVGRHLTAAGSPFGADSGARLVAAPRGVDLRDPVQARRLVDDVDPDGVFHLAAVTFVPDSFANPWETFEVNLRGTLNLLTAVSQKKRARPFVFMSTAEVYGAVPEEALPVREDRPFAPRSPYGVSKVAGEVLCLQTAIARDLDVRIARPFNMIGPGQDSRFVMSSFARQIAALERKGGGQIEVGNLDVTRDFVDVRDAVAALLAIVRSGKPGEAYNICSGRETVIEDALSRLVARARVPIEVVVDPARVRPNEQRRVCGSFEKLAQHTGWRPGVALDDTLGAVLDDWRSADRDAKAS